ncbi:MAG TPA: hypothetical protein VMW48_06380 [Vicinamibacterales bacterium]|nr:hypothetical protein [Vicinamibacterales bacterium]
MVNISAYTLMLFLHIGAAIALVGHTLGAPALHASLREATTASDVARLLGFAGRSARWNLAASLVLLVSGLSLGAAGWWQQSWFALAVAAWIANALLATRVVKPSAGALMAAAVSTGDGPVGREMERLRHSTGWALAARAMIANDLAILYVMIDKPGLAHAAGVMLVAHTALAGVWFARHRTTGSVVARRDETRAPA